jgi:hypothetical protein
MNVLTGGEVVWSVIILLSVGLAGTAWVIYKVLIWDNEENNNSDHDHHASSNS